MMTTPAAAPTHLAVWGKETVTLTTTVVQTLCVARTTVWLENPHWTVVNEVKGIEATCSLQPVTIRQKCFFSYIFFKAMNVVAMAEVSL